MLRKRPAPEDRALQRARGRAARIPTPELLSWADQAIFGIGRHMDRYRRSGISEDLQEAVSGAAALYAVLSEVERRSNFV